MAVLAMEKDDTKTAHAETAEDLSSAQNAEEQELTPTQALRKYPRVVFWCCFAIWILFLSSFDNQAGGVVLGIPQFRKDFGHAFDGGYVLPAGWQSAHSGGPTASTVIGALGSSWVADKIGRKYTLALDVLNVLVGITLETISTTNPVFFAGKLINGFSVGAFVTVSMAYVGEIVPLALRGSITAACAVSFTIGSLVAALIVNGTSNQDSRWAYRIIFVSQYGVAGVAAIGLPFLPESPWWLLSKGKQDKALKSLRRLGYSADEVTSKIAGIQTVLDKSLQETAGASFLECFRASNFRRMCVGIDPLIVQALGGAYFIAAYSTYYLQLGGYTVSESFQINIGQQVLSMSGNILSWFIIDRFGRRPLTVWGSAFTTLLLVIAGGLGLVQQPSFVKGTVAMMWMWCFFYNFTIGATAYTLMAEIATARLRAKTAAIGLATQQAIFTMWAFVIPYLFNPDQANLGGRIAFIFSGLGVLCTVLLWLYLPETMGRTYEELDEMFMKRVPAWQFKSYQTDAQMNIAAEQRSLKE
ncbi:unnamed protein product [Clonostachys byssicola]|uniref:Major facilitator superfamily (MFS) profile domain-containing protein n=1 Tax=Clonostachys byssicola TaxID=160290 RepID=A0A9N9U3Z7_9HYPO|nr:unnamed protein product [Clonostachys byssicola]